MKKLFLLLKFLRTGLTLRNLLISIFGGLAMLLLLFVIQFFIEGSFDSLRWDNDFIFYMIVGASIALIKFEKPPLSWEEYWKKNK
ncbi:MAG: hypothetical protein CMG94_01535 [Marinoscillum sp.]|nr:hypothetical protein [Marinoscillum sp.]|tara:strand:+ start:234 stop:488 length:255 start_codon:yes stop_codon:yes gene_type:complete